MEINDIISNINVYGIENALRCSKYPMSTNVETCTHTMTNTVKKLAQCKLGTGHDNFLNGIIVQFDLTFTVKAWTEMERYHFIDFISSQSTMHRITGFNLDEAYVKYVDPRMVAVMKEKVTKYNEFDNEFEPRCIGTQKQLAEEKKELYLEILYSNPCGMKLTAGMTTNYRQLKTIYEQRKTHRLPEWRVFCDWIKTLPYSELIIGENE